ncbi:MAG: hypothetical protein M0006_15525 [Magnetospirillum sp.]|nr:hypothetical protein [Magnetospirillum sp.]
MDEPHPTLFTLLPALVLLVFSLLWTGALVLWPENGTAVAAIFPPAQAGEGALAGVVAAGAEAVQGFGAWSTVVVARSADPAFVANLYRQGALVVVKAAAVDECSR